MSLTIDGIARAFSGHDFKAAYPYLTDDVSWAVVGDMHLTGRDDVIGACEQAAAYLAELTTEFRRFRVLVGATWVVIDSLAEYTDGEQKISTVASCDIYDFRDGLLSAITSYNIELADT